MALNLALLGSKLGWPERTAASWFGPKGFAAMIYGILLLDEGAPQAHLLFSLTAAVVVLSILVHSSSDELVARWFRRRQREQAHKESAKDQEAEASAPASAGEGEAVSQTEAEPES